MADEGSAYHRGRPGLRKTTLAQQVLLGRCGVPEFSKVLGIPITPLGPGEKVLVLAMDRPNQYKRMLRRLFTPEIEPFLRGRFILWEGPPIEDIARNPHHLLELIEKAGATDCHIDSIKDAAVGLSDDAVGAGYNRARQIAIAAGKNILETHHTRKGASDSKTVIKTIDDIYGSTWITSGAGSVISLTGTTGDPVVEFTHLKIPAEPIPRMMLEHLPNGRTVVLSSDTADLFTLVKAAGDKGISAAEAALALFGEAEQANDKRNDRLKARRALERLAKAGTIQALSEGKRGGGGSGESAARWWVPALGRGNGDE